jgi:alkanesulfonate monooxygenase SsuD/methylene tetrahydromethanopterin reductase-like flavin-dependent oxidoreductase (luciferase family)
MLGPGRATFDGSQARVSDAINVPKGVQRPRVPVMVGGNGPNRTWRLAARYADELNLDWLSPAEVRDARRVIASRCEEIGRDPDTLRVSVNIGRTQSAVEGRARVDLLRAYGDAGVDRVMTLIRAAADDEGALARFADDCLAAGCELETGQAGIDA